MLGVVTGMPLGVINVAIVDAAARGRTRFATGIAIGGALADTTHAAIAFAGVGRVVTAHPTWTRPLAAGAALVIVGYVMVAARARPQVESRVAARNGVLAGLALTLPNPAAFAAWLAVAGVVWPAMAVLAALVLAAGVGLGSALWFVLLGRWVSKLPADARVRRVVPRVALVLLAGLGVAGIARAWLT